MNIKKQDTEKNLASYAKCPLQLFISTIGGKWKLLILWELHNYKVLRFNELKKAVCGITNTMLSKSLEELEHSNLVIRKQYNEMPLRVEYRLSQKSESLIPILEALTAWGEEQLKEAQLD